MWLTFGNARPVLEESYWRQTIRPPTPTPWVGPTAPPMLGLQRLMLEILRYHRWDIKKSFYGDITRVTDFSTWNNWVISDRDVPSTIQPLPPVTSITCNSPLLAPHYRLGRIADHFGLQIITNKKSPPLKRAQTGMFQILGWTTWKSPLVQILPHPPPKGPVSAISDFQPIIWPPCTMLEGDFKQEWIITQMFLSAYNVAKGVWAMNI